MRVPYSISCSLLIWLLLSGTFLFLSCFGRGYRNRLYRENLVERIILEEGKEAGDKHEIREIKAMIRKSQGDIEMIIEKQKKRSHFMRILGYRYMDEKMWFLANKAFNDSMNLEPQNIAALYNRALSASYMAKNEVSSVRKNEYLMQAEKDYRMALDINPGYTPAMYALAVLLIFELDRASESEAFLRKFLSVEKSHINAHFLLARVLHDYGMQTEAANLYRQIEDMAPKKEDRDRAREIRENNYGS